MPQYFLWFKLAHKTLTITFLEFAAFGSKKCRPTCTYCWHFSSLRIRILTIWTQTSELGFTTAVIVIFSLIFSPSVLRSAITSVLWNTTDHLSHWGWDKMVDFIQMTFSHAFSSMEIIETSLKFVHEGSTDNYKSFCLPYLMAWPETATSH